MEDKWSYHFWFGLKEKYPLCCILWFSNVQTNWGLQQDSLYERILREAYDENKVNLSSGMGRAMCPNCLAEFLRKQQSGDSVE